MYDARAFRTRIILQPLPSKEKFKRLRIQSLTVQSLRYVTGGESSQGHFTARIRPSALKNEHNADEGNEDENQPVESGLIDDRADLLSERQEECYRQQGYHSFD